MMRPFTDLLLLYLLAASAKLLFFFPGIETFGKNAVVCGRSKNVGLPIAMLLHGDGIRPDGEPFPSVTQSKGKSAKEIFN